MNQPFMHDSPTIKTNTAQLSVGSEMMLASAVLCIPNLGLFMHYSHALIGFNLPLSLYVIWLAMNLVALGALFTLRQWLVIPLTRITSQLQILRSAFAHESSINATSPLNIPRLAMDIGRFAAFALEHYRKHQEAVAALDHARSVIAQFAIEQEAILASASREIITQYQAVLAYAHYLDEQIANHKVDSGIRYDFDDVSESSFNLKLIAGALGMLKLPEVPAVSNIVLASLMQQTMLALAPALDRRSMKLTTLDVDMSVAARGDASTLAQILWMMLLGMIRYAADESTLRLRCLHSRDGTKALLSIVVSELSPGCMSEDERSDHLTRRLQHLTPHMFAETLRIHGNVQLANLLIARISGEISVVPLTISSCEICMILPSAEIPSTVS